MLSKADNLTDLSTQILAKRYLSALSLLLLLFLLAYVIMLNKQQNISENLTLFDLITRQEVLSQKICKMALQLQTTHSLTQRLTVMQDLAQTLNLLQQTHEQMAVFNLHQIFFDEQTAFLFSHLDLGYSPFNKANAELLKIITNPNVSPQHLQAHVSLVLVTGDNYFLKLEQIATLYPALIGRENQAAYWVMLSLVSVVIVFLLLDTFWVFRPALTKIQAAFTLAQQTQRLLQQTNESLQQQMVALAQSQQEYRVLVDNSLQGLTIIRGNTLCFINQRLATLLGYETTAEVLAMSAQDMQAKHTHPTSIVTVDGYWRARLRGEVVPVQYEVQVITTTQQLKWVEQYVTLIDYQGQPAIQVATVDITARKRAEEQLAESERFLRRLTDMLPGMVGYWSADLRCVFANQAYSNWFELTSTQLLGLSLREVLGETLFQQNEPFIQGVLQGHAQEFERTLIKPDGSKKYVWVQYMPDTPNDQLQGFFVLATDITPLKRAQESLQASELKLRTVIELLPVGILMMDKNQQVIEVNLAATQILDLPLPKHRSCIYGDGTPIPPGQLPCQRAIELQQASYNVEVGFIQPDQTVIWTLVSAAPLAVGDVAAVTVMHDITDRKKISEELQQRQLYLTMLVNLQKILLGIENVPRWYDYFLLLLGQTTQVSRVAYFEIQTYQDDYFMNLESEWLQPGIPPILGDSHWQNLALHGLPTWEANLLMGNPLLLETGQGAVAEQEMLQRQGVVSLLVLPLRVNYHLFGLVTLAECYHTRQWNDIELDMLWTAMASVSLYMERLQVDKALRAANQELAHLAHHDGLTRIANRRRFDQYLAEQWQQLAGIGLPLAIIMVDVDHFKLYNDTYGHFTGDVCLRRLAELMRHVVKRTKDLVARYGGEEFTVILPNTDEAGAVHVARQIHEAVTQLQIPFEVSPTHPYITISLGVSAMIPNPALPPDHLVIQADLALYQAKQQGRNKIIYQAG